MNTAQFNQLEMLEYRAASALVAFEDRAKALLEKSEVRETLNFVVAVILAVTLMMVARYAFGTDGVEFQQGSTTLEDGSKAIPEKLRTRWFDVRECARDVREGLRCFRCPVGNRHPDRDNRRHHRRQLYRDDLTGSGDVG